VLLPGRERWLHACHPNPVDCDQCLERVAEFLARELEYDLDRALAKTTPEYRADLGEDICTLDRAADLHRMTATVCADVRRRNPDLETREYYCEVEEHWQDEPCFHFNCRPPASRGTNVLRFPAQSPTCFPAPAGWAKWKHTAASCLLWPLLVAIGGIFFAGVVMLALLAACGGEEA
jgi:hypothetical protein